MTNSIYVIKSNKSDIHGNIKYIYSNENDALKKMYHMSYDIFRHEIRNDFIVERQQPNNRNAYQTVKVYILPELYGIENRSTNFITKKLWNDFVDEFPSTILLQRFKSHSQILKEYFRLKKDHGLVYMKQRNIKQKFINDKLYYTDSDIYGLRTYHQQPNASSDTFVDHIMHGDNNTTAYTIFVDHIMYDEIMNKSKEIENQIEADFVTSHPYPIFQI
jgi:hypothetical protein